MTNQRLKVYDFDPSWDAADGEDDKGEYVLRDLDYISSDGSAVLCMGARSRRYSLTKTVECVTYFPEEWFEKEVSE